RMANAAFFDALAKPVTLMNAGRGEVVDEEALLAARDAGKARHLVLDVFPGEPNVRAALLARCDLATPHIAGYSIQGKLNGTTQIHDAFRAHFGLEKKSEVRYPAPESPRIAYEALGVPEQASTEAALHACVRRAYDIARDDADLRDFEGSAGRPE